MSSSSSLTDLISKIRYMRQEISFIRSTAHHEARMLTSKEHDRIDTLQARIDTVLDQIDQVHTLRHRNFDMTPLTTTEQQAAIAS